MLRKITLAFVIVVMISVCDISHAAMKRNVTAKYKGPVLKACSIYQLGENEFILKLSGSKLPRPETDSRNDSLYITLNDCKTYRPDAINSLLNAVIEGIPMIYEVKAENVSDDESFWSVVTVRANFPLKSSSISRSHDGWQLRVKSDKRDDVMFGGTYVPPPKMIPSPETKLPFSISDTVTLELRDAALPEIIRGIMAYVGRNVIIDPSFPKKIVRAEQSVENNGVKMTQVTTEEKDMLLTMTLNNVRVDEIMNYLMGAYDIACYVSGTNTLTFGSREGLYKLSGENSIKQFKIHFAEPSQISTMLNVLAGVEAGAITVDDRIKALYVKTNPAKMQEVEELISILDAPQKQVMIKASIFEFNDSDTAAVSNALNIAYDDIRISLGGLISMDYRADRSIMRTPTPWTDRVITAAFSALEQKGKGKVLANPSVIALDGKLAAINLTQDYPYISDRDNQKGTVTWSTEEVGPKLTFTPRIGRDGYVTLNLDISTGDVIATQSSSTGEQMPVTTTRSVNTEVRVRDGMPFVIGGLFREDTTKNVSKIPILGNIPLLGELFTYRTNAKVKTQVVMVVTPYILDSN